MYYDEEVITRWLQSGTITAQDALVLTLELKGLPVSAVPLSNAHAKLTSLGIVPESTNTGAIIVLVIVALWIVYG